MTKRSIEVLAKIVSAHPQVFFRPMAFFVARCGVLTLVFDGFGKAILDLKRKIEKAFPHLEPEHEGSTWPKVTLAVLKDHEALTARDIVKLRDIADDWNDVLRNEGDVLEIRELAAVEYGCRSLEKRYHTVQLPLMTEEFSPDTPEHHAAYVQSVVSQFSRDRMDQYAAELEKDGNRETHYRGPARGWSLVADIAADRLPLANTLMDQVDRLVPGKYCRMEPASRHVTIRSLDTVGTKRNRPEIEIKPTTGAPKVDRLAD